MLLDLQNPQITDKQAETYKQTEITQILQSYYKNLAIFSQKYYCVLATYICICFLIIHFVKHCKTYGKFVSKSELELCLIELTSDAVGRWCHFARCSGAVEGRVV